MSSDLRREGDQKELYSSISLLALKPSMQEIVETEESCSISGGRLRRFVRHVEYDSYPFFSDFTPANDRDLFIPGLLLAPAVFSVVLRALLVATPTSLLFAESS
ncbi:hypothetical protein BDW59DRAFT_141158 [Aspergillus cavernicola]|uniref:Uncharacterized protein n=1 Tax=Aspergillus cavernicola TaxID=176166 RepID=A0ABR4IS47_9EURO